MFGSTPASLHVYLDYIMNFNETASRTLVLRRTKKMPDIWIKDEVELTQMESVNWRLTFEAFVFGKFGDVAIDNVQLDVKECESMQGTVSQYQKQASIIVVRYVT